MHKSNYSLEVLVNGRPVREVYKDNRSFIESRVGTEYTLRFRNNSWKRVMAIFSVDGIEVLKGKAASEADNGYIVDAFSNVEIKGYRIDDKNVAAFQFAKTDKGYNVVVGAAKVDKTTGETTYDKSAKNSGVIGVRVIEEASADHDYSKSSISSFGGSSTWNNIAVSGCVSSSVAYISGGCISPTSMGGTIRTFYPTMGMATSGPQDLSATAFNCCASSVGHEGSVCSDASFPISRQSVHQMGQLNQLSRSIAPSFDASTAWGTKLEDKVKEVSFKRSTNVVDIEIYYASRASLEEFGLDFSNTKQVFAWPSAFEDKKQYCKLPPGYKA